SRTIAARWSNGRHYRQGGRSTQSFRRTIDRIRAVRAPYIWRSPRQTAWRLPGHRGGSKTLSLSSTVMNASTLGNTSSHAKSSQQVKDRSASKSVRRLPIGAEVQPGGGVHFRVWAPRRERVDVVVGPGTLRQS